MLAILSRRVKVYFVDREGAPKSREPIDATGMACEDLIVGDPLVTFVRKLAI